MKILIVPTAVLFLSSFTSSGITNITNINSFTGSQIIETQIEQQIEIPLISQEEIEKQKLENETIEKKQKFITNVNKYLTDNRLKLSEETLNIVFEKSSNYNVNPYLVISQIKKESTFRSNAYNQGCIGYLQVSKYPLIGYNKIHNTNFKVSDLYNERVNLEIGIFYLSEKLNKFNNEHLALMAYNGGEGYLNRMVKGGINNSYYSRTILNLAKEIENY